MLQVVFWMLWGDFFFQLLESLPTLTPLLLRSFGASDTTIGLISGTMSSVVTFFWHPVVATRGDRHRSPLGRRRPFILYWMTPLVLSLLMIGAVKPAGQWLYRALSVFGSDAITVAGCSIVWIAMFLVLFLLFNAFIVQSFNCLIVDVIPPEVMGRFGGTYRAVGALGSLAFNRWALGSVHTHTFHLFLIIGLLFIAAFSVIIWKVKEGEYPPPPPRAPGGRIGAVKDYLRTCLRHPFYLNFFFVTFFYWASLSPLGFVVFFGTSAGKEGYAATLGLPLQDFGEVKGWTFIVQIPVYFISGFLCDRFHPLRVAFWGLVGVVVTYFCCYFFIHDRDSLLWWWSINQVPIAIYLGAIVPMGPRLLPRDRYGQFISANISFGMISLIFMPIIIGQLLGTLRDYRQVFIFCGVLNTFATIALGLLYAQWKKLGGDEHFEPPDPTQPPRHLARSA